MLDFRITAVENRPSANLICSTCSNDPRWRSYTQGSMQCRICNAAFVQPSSSCDHAYTRTPSTTTPVSSTPAHSTDLSPPHQPSPGIISNPPSTSGPDVICLSCATSQLNIESHFSKQKCFSCKNNIQPVSTPGWKPINLTSTSDPSSPDRSSPRSSSPSTSTSRSSATPPATSISSSPTPPKRSRRPPRASELSGLSPSNYKRFQDLQALLQPMTSHLSPVIQSTTLNLLHKALSQRWFASVSYSSNKHQVACALIFEACKRCGEPRDMKEISRLCGLDPGQNFRKYVSLMNRKLVTLGAFEGTSAATMPWDLLPRYAERLGVPQVVEAAIGVAKAVGAEMILGSRAANNVAASCLYVACILGGYPKGLRQLAEGTAEVTKGTIQKSVKIIHAKEKVLTSNAFWPGDLNLAFWDMMIDPRYYYCTAKPLPKKKVELIVVEGSDSEYEGNCKPNSSEDTNVDVRHAVQSACHTDDR